MDAVDWSVLRGAVVYSHPLLPSVVVKCLALSRHEDPRRLRTAVDALATAHATSAAAFSLAMDEIVASHDLFLRTKGLPRGQMPLVVVQLRCMEALRHAEEFFRHDESKRNKNAMSCIELCLDMCVVSSVDSQREFLSLATSILELIRCEGSPFRINHVAIDFGECDFRDENVTRLATRVATLALEDAESFKVAICVGGGCSLVSMGRLFQSICRVGVPSRHEGRQRELSVTTKCDPRLAGTLWSAVAFSSGYKTLTIREEVALFAAVHDFRRTSAMYLAQAVLGRTSDIRRINCEKFSLSAYELEAIYQAATLTSFEDLTKALWDRDWTINREANVFEIASLNSRIVSSHGFILHDPGSGEWIDVLVPGFAQCSVKRDQWQLLRTERATGESVSLPKLEDIRVSLVHANLRGDSKFLHYFQPVGGSLTSLELVEGSYAFPPEGLMAIFASCPVLRTLEVGKMGVPSELMTIDPAAIVSKDLSDLRLRVTSDQGPPTAADDFFSEIIPFIGRKLKKLYLASGPTAIPFSRSFGLVITSCRLLLDLKLTKMDIKTLDPLIESYIGEESHISHLCLVACPFDYSSLRRLAYFLGDRAQPASSRLRSLACSDMVGVQDTSYEEAIEATLHMLELNSTLQSLVLTESFRRSERVSSLAHQLIKFNGQSLPVVRRLGHYPVALISAFQHANLPWDQVMIRLVSEFAASRVRREVKCWI